MDIQPIVRREHLPTRIAADFAQRIRGGSLQPGDKLPTEQVLSRTLGVSRTVVREAIAQLRSEGLVETRQGVGAFVAQSPGQIRLQSGGDMDRHQFTDLYQLRVPLEIEAAGIAAENRGDDDLRAIDEALDRMSSQDEWETEGVTADLDFHRRIAQATGNEYFVQFIGVIADRVAHVIVAGRSHMQAHAIFAHTIAEHTAIRDAIRDRDPKAARAAMRAHLIGSAARVGLNLHFH